MTQHRTTLSSLVGLGLLLVSCHSEFAAAQPPASELSQLADGQQDATEAIQSLVDAGGSIRLPPGSYRISRTIVIDLASTGYFALDATPATKLIMSGPGPALLLKGSHFKSADPAGFEQIVWDQERMPYISGLAIEGEHSEADGIAALGTMQLTVSKVHLRKLRHGIHLRENNRNLVIEACHIYQNRGIGIFYDDVNLHQSNIIGSHISYCDQGGIVSRKGNVRNIHITGCDLESNMAADQTPTANIFIDCRGSRYGTAEVAITGCTIQHNDHGPQSSNIRMIGSSAPSVRGESGQREGHVTITGNVLSDVSTNIWLDSCRGVTILGNTCWMGFEHNLLVERCSHLIVGPNNFDRNPRYNYGRSLEAKNQLVFRDCQDCTLNGLHVAHVGDGVAAVSLEDCHRFNVSGLTILDCELGLKLERVTGSAFTGCLIRNDRGQADTPQTLMVQSHDNRFDDSFNFPLKP